MATSLPFDLTDDLSKLPEGQLSYVKWLQHRLQDIHKAVGKNLEETRQEMKTSYDRRSGVLARKCYSLTSGSIQAGPLSGRGTGHVT